MSITTEHVFTLDIEIGAPREVGATAAGFRRVIPITGGRVHGPQLEGKVLPGGADWNLMRADGVVEVWARYEIETTEGTIISVINEGSAFIDREAAAAAGSAPTLITRPRFEVPLGAPAWLATGTFVGELQQLPPTGVQVVVYRLATD